MKILGIAGSLRKDSFNRKLLAAMGGMLPESAEYSMGEIGNLPLFNQDDEKERYPTAATVLKEAIREAGGVIIATPEYNRSIPGVLKNALDWTDRPSGDSAWENKPVLVAGASDGMIGTALAQYDLKKVLMHAGVRVSSEEVIIGTFKERFDEAGVITDEDTKHKLAEAVAAFVDFVQLHSGKKL